MLSWTMNALSSGTDDFMRKVVFFIGNSNLNRFINPSFQDNLFIFEYICWSQKVVKVNQKCVKLRIRYLISDLSLKKRVDKLEAFFEKK